MRDEYVIGVDGGGTKTTVALANLDGKIVKKIKTKGSNINKLGFKRAISNLEEAISKISRSKKINYGFVGLAGGLERNKIKKEKIKRYLRKKFEFPIDVEGDQIIAFRAGTDRKDGIVVIAGTGSISMGWKKGREEISGGWDWLFGDQGSGFWVGRKVLEEIAKSLDGRRKNLKLKNFIFRKLKIKNGQDLYQKFYSEDFIEKVASLSKFVDQFSQKGDNFSKSILIKAAEEVSKMAITVIKKLNFKNEEFPVVLSGGMFNSKIFLSVVKRRIKEEAKDAKFILLKNEPVVGAIKLAIERYKSS